MKPFEGIKAVLFDLDNTLIVRRLTLRKLAQYVNRFYFADRPDEHEWIADVFWDCFSSGYDELEDCFAAFQRRVGWTHKADCKEFLDFWFFYYPFCTTMEPNAEAVRELTRKGYRIGILTNGPAVLQQGKVDVVGFRDWFEFILATGEVGPEKPDPYPFRYVMDKMGLRPEEIVYVGDYPPNDIEAPRKLGMHTVWFSAYADWDDRYERAEAEISSLLELPALFPDLTKK